MPDDFSEDLLSAHESELDRMRGFYQDNKDIFELLEKRDRLWQQQLELDVRSRAASVITSVPTFYPMHTYTLFLQRQSNDPNRFNNRGGQLQKQLKLHKQLEKELPRTEKEVQTILLQWEEDHERHFVVLDTRFLDVLEQQIEERSHRREKEKIKKVSSLILVLHSSLSFCDCDGLCRRRTKKTL